MAEISRRTLFNRCLLAGAAAAGVALGVTKSVHHKVSVPPSPPPVALTSVRNANLRLLAQYDANLEAFAASNSTSNTATASLIDRLNSLRSDVTMHGEVIETLLQRYPGWRFSRANPTASDAPSPAVIGAASTKSLADATTAALRVYTGACLAWPAAEQGMADVVPLLGSMSACLATHSAILA